MTNIPDNKKDPAGKPAKAGTVVLEDADGTRQDFTPPTPNALEVTVDREGSRYTYLRSQQDGDRWVYRCVQKEKLPPEAAPLPAEPPPPPTAGRMPAPSPHPPPPVTDEDEDEEPAPKRQEPKRRL